eukprot:205396-Rhodomonas_salina.6
MLRPVDRYPGYPGTRVPGVRVPRYALFMDIDIILFACFGALSWPGSRGSVVRRAHRELLVVIELIRTRGQRSGPSPARFPSVTRIPTRECISEGPQC